MVLRGMGGFMMVYALPYLPQHLFSALHDDPRRVWDVMNVVSALGILIALDLNSHRDALAARRGIIRPGGDRGAHVLLYVKAAPAIWFLHNWTGLLTLEEASPQGYTTSWAGTSSR